MKFNTLYILSCSFSALVGAGLMNYFSSGDNYVVAPEAQKITTSSTMVANTPIQQTTICPTDISSPQQETPVTQREQELQNQLNNLQENFNEQKSKTFSKWMQKQTQTTKNFNLRDTMQQRFEDEPIDSTWAEQQEHEYRQLFSENKNLSDYALTATQCRSTQCELTISITNTDQANQILTDIATSLQEQNQFPFIIAAPDKQQGNTKIYVTNAANSFDTD